MMKWVKVRLRHAPERMAYITSDRIEAVIDDSPMDDGSPASLIWLTGNDSVLRTADSAREIVQAIVDPGAEDD